MEFGVRRNLQGAPALPVAIKIRSPSALWVLRVSVVNSFCGAHRSPFAVRRSSIRARPRTPNSELNPRESAEELQTGF